MLKEVIKRLTSRKPVIEQLDPISPQEAAKPRSLAASPEANFREIDEQTESRKTIIRFKSDGSIVQVVNGVEFQEPVRRPESAGFGSWDRNRDVLTGRPLK